MQAQQDTRTDSTDYPPAIDAGDGYRPSWADTRAELASHRPVV